VAAGNRLATTTKYLHVVAGIGLGTELELELELIQNQMAQRPTLRAEVYARA
jgi:hypothetical protein